MKQSLPVMITLTLSLTTLPSVTYKNERKGDSSDIEKRATAPHLPTAFTLSWSGLTYEVNGCTILSDVSGELRSGQMYAVMGPSGACLLNATV